jgi:diguanylate cyclase (GGDEF)-like protein
MLLRSRSVIKKMVPRIFVGAGRRGLLFTLMSCILLAICVMFGLVMCDARIDVGRQVATAAANVAAAVAHDVDRNIESIDLSIQAVTLSWGNPAVRALSPALQQLVLFDHSATAQDFGIIVVLDQKGVIRASSHPLGSQSIDLSTQDYFKVHQTGADVGLFVSKPFVSRLTGLWQIGLSRRINNPDGSFGGVVVGTLRVAYLNKLYKALNLGQDGSITLIRTDGTIITREPFREGDIRSLADGPTFGVVRSAASGSFEGVSPVDGQRKIVSFHRVGNLPLIQDVEISTEQAYSAWSQKAMIIGGALLFLCLCSLSLLLLLNGELSRRIEIEAVLERLAATDPLTQLANRRRFAEALDVEWRRAARDMSPLSLLMIDADHFKSFNDNYGHPAGDELLKSIATCLSAIIRRPADLAARYGGEEFAVVLPDTDPAGALKVAESVRHAMLALACPHVGAANRVATLSIGVATVRPRQDQSSELLVQAADSALYRAKAAGRNCCRAASLPRGTPQLIAVA